MEPRQPHPGRRLVRWVARILVVLALISVAAVVYLANRFGTDRPVTYADIAEQTGLAQGGIATTVVRAKRKLIEAYDALERNDAALG